MNDNPFVFNQPVDPKNNRSVFFHRERSLKKAVLNIQAGEWLLITGPRKCGKSSFIRQLHSLLGEYGSGAFCCVVENTGALLSDDFSKFADDLIAKLGKTLKLQSSAKKRLFNDSTDLKTALADLIKLTSAKTRIVIVIDGFENASSKFARELFAQISRIFCSLPAEPDLRKIQFIFSGSFSSENISLEDEGFLRESSTTIELKDVGFSESNRMLEKVCARYDITLEPGFTRLIYEETQGTPYLIQRICSAIVENALLSRKSPVFAKQEAEKVLSEFVKNGDALLEKIVRTVEQSQSLLKSLVRFFSNSAVKQSRLDRELSRLHALGALSFNSGVFRFRNPLFARFFQGYFTTERLTKIYISHRDFLAAGKTQAASQAAHQNAEDALQSLLANAQRFEEISNSSGLIEKVLTVFLKSIEGAHHCGLFVFDELSKKIHVKDMVGPATKALKGFRARFGEGVTGAVFQTGKARIIKDVTDEIETPDFIVRQEAERLNLGAMASLPLVAHGEVFAVVNLCLSKPYVITPSDEKLLKTMAYQASLVLQNFPARMNENSRRLEMLEQVFEAVNTHIDSEIAFNHILTAFAKMRNQKTVFVAWQEQSNLVWRFKFNLEEADVSASLSLGMNSIDSRPLGSAEALLGAAKKVLKEGRPGYNVSEWRWVQFAQAWPIKCDSDRVGYLVAASPRKRKTSRFEAGLFALLAQMCAAVISKKRIYNVARKKTDQFVSLAGVGEFISKQLNEKELLGRIAQAGLDAIDGVNKSVQVLLKENEKEQLVVKAVQGGSSCALKVDDVVPFSDDTPLTRALREKELQLSKPNNRKGATDRKEQEDTSEFAAPIVFQEEVLGVISAKSRGRTDARELNKESLQALSRNAAIAIKVADLCGNQLRELQVLYGTGQKIVVMRNIDQILRTICLSALRAFGSHERLVSIYLLYEADNRIARKFSRGFKRKYNGDTQVRLEQNAFYELVVNRRKRVFIPDISIGPKFRPSSPDIKSALVVPILINSPANGFVVMESEIEDDFGDAEFRLLKGLADQAGIAIENAMLKKELAQTQTAFELAAIEEAFAEIAHDIRNVSTMISGETQWLVKNQKDGVVSFAEVEAAALKIEAQVKRIETLANPADHMHKLPPVLKPVDIGDLLNEAIALVETSAHEDGIRIRLIQRGVKTKMPADGHRLVRAFFNILKNAVDASPPGGAIKISVMQTENEFVVQFVDSGKGIDEEIQHKIFTPLFTTKTTGSGLGLSLTRRIIERDHGGSLSVESNLGAGTTVCVSLPIKPQKKREEKLIDPIVSMPGQTDVGGLKVQHKHILVVNDETDLLQRIQHTLQDSGFMTTGMERGAEAVKLCKKKRYDLVLMDFDLKKDTSENRNASDFLPEIRNLLPETPIIITSASVSKNELPRKNYNSFLEINSTFWTQLSCIVDDFLHNSAKGA